MEKDKSKDVDLDKAEQDELLDSANSLDKVDKTGLVNISTKDEATAKFIKDDGEPESSALVICTFLTDSPGYSAKKGDEKLMQPMIAEQLAHYGVVEILSND